MKTLQVRKIRIFNIFLNFCAFWALANFKPIPDLEFYPEDCVHPGKNYDLLRVRRSIPDMDAVNPVFLETEPESEASQELSGSSKDNDISLFPLSNPVNGFFRSQKGQEPQQLPSNQDSSNLAEERSKEQKIVGRDILSVPEQEECYKQQNIESPGDSDEAPRHSLKIKDYRPFSDFNIHQQKAPLRPQIFKDKGTKRLREKEEGTMEITSLYSDPERRPRFRKGKSMSSQLNHNNALDQLSDRSVYKPVGVRAEFPVYDEDIDFHPDPLQGILEDKYWLDPQEQEAVIRKYIDLASNMQPVRIDYRKRDLHRGEYIPKSVDSKGAFKEAEAVDKECPCREVASCEDCSKGKWKKKSNYSERELSFLDGNYGSRKLLSLNYDNVQEEESSEDSSMNKDTKAEPDIKSNEHSSDYYEYIGELDRKAEEETQVDEEVPSFTSKYFGRKLLSFEDDDDTKEVYGVDEDNNEYATDYEAPEYPQDQREPEEHFKSECSDIQANSIKKTDNRRSIILNDNADARQENDRGSTVIKKPTSVMYEYKLETEKLSDLNNHLIPNSTEEFLHFQKPFLDNTHNIARYYVPNRLGNLLQKAIKQKPKEAPSTIDPNLEFAIERNQTYVNVSIEMKDLNVSFTTEMAKLVKYNHKRGDLPVILRGKGRRSYNLPLIKHPHVKTVEDVVNIDPQGSNGTVNSTSSGTGALSTNATLNATVNGTTNATDSGNNKTDASSITTDTTTNSTTDTVATSNTTSTTEKPKKKLEEYDEDTFDAEIANDIVETVIAESQSGSVVGHNLGLCRRNSTISKYAKVSPESEKLLKKVTECILEKIRDRLEGQSCTLLDNDLLQFLKWMVLSGESYKDYMARVEPQFKKIKPELSVEQISTVSPK